jgi:hypothetical protein
MNGHEPISNRLQARVEKGRLVLNEPTDLPEGTVLDLVADERIEDLDPEEREALHAALDHAIEQVERGEVVSAETVLARLRARG